MPLIDGEETKTPIKQWTAEHHKRIDIDAIMAASATKDKYLD